MLRFSYLIFSVLILQSCATAQKTTEFVLKPEAFEQKLTMEDTLILLDVRTPKEFSGGHLKDAKNINWNDDNFESQITNIDKNIPVYVYCLSGGRSHNAAEKMRADGWNRVYEMEGGMMQWRAAGLPEVNKPEKVKGMSGNDFQALLETDKLVLIDFYAEWCGPCKKMKPYLDEIDKDMSQTVKLIRIDTDANEGLIRSMKINSIPVLQLYKNKKLIWSNVGYIDKKSVYKQLN